MRRQALFLAALLFCGEASLSAEQDAEETEPPVVAPPSDDITLDGVSGTVTGSLQGKDGLRIQTLCTHCNSANIQVGGLAQEFSPVSVDGYPIFGGLATSLVFSILPADTIAGAKVLKGPGAAISPSRSAGGQIFLQESTPDELPMVDATLEGGTYDRVRGTARIAGSLNSRISGSLVVGHDEADPIDDDNDGFNDVSSVDRDFAEGRMTFSLGRNHTIDVGASWIDEENLEGRGAYSQFALGSDPVFTREDALFEREEYRAGWSWDLGRGRELELRLLDAVRHQTQRSELEDSLTGAFTGQLYDRFEVREDNEWGALEYSNPIGLQSRINFGLEAYEQKVRASTIEGNDLVLYLTFPDFLDEPEPQLGTDSVESWSAFADYDWTISPKWGLRLGVRHEDAEWKADGLPQPFGMPDAPTTAKRSDSHTAPRATLRYKPGDAWTLKLIAGGTFRTPKPILAEICCGQRYQRNVATAAETGESFGFEGIYQPSPDLRVSVYAARTPTPPSSRSAGRRFVCCPSTEAWGGCRTTTREMKT
jgi:outer membrane receptor protein involved in Fe transport